MAAMRLMRKVKTIAWREANRERWRGPAYKKTYKRVYEGGRLRNRRVYRIPLLEEAALTPGQDVARVA